MSIEETALQRASVWRLEHPSRPGMLLLHWRPLGIVSPDQLDVQEAGG